MLVLTVGVVLGVAVAVPLGWLCVRGLGTVMGLVAFQQCWPAVAECVAAVAEAVGQALSGS